MNVLEQDKKDLIELILWYQNDYYHSNDSFFDEIIDEILNCEDRVQLELYYKIVDGWIDY
jgi:hypothetical protein